jgi:hypothetical protein
MGQEAGSGVSVPERYIAGKTDTGNLLGDAYYSL